MVHELKHSILSFLCVAHIVVLTACGGGSSSLVSNPPPASSDPASAPTGSAPASAPASPAATVTEVPARPMRIAFVVSAAQMSANGAKIQRFADVLVSDLNRRGYARSGLNASTFSVDIVRAGADAESVRNQLKPYDSAMLIGTVPVPLIYDGIEGLVKPLLEPFRLPSCALYGFQNNGNHLNPFSQIITFDPSCRYRIPVSVLRGLSQNSDLVDVDRKLNQFIAYHSNSDQANLTWRPDFQYIGALWGGEPPKLTSEVLTNIWPIMTLAGVANSYSSPIFVTQGTAEARKIAFANCIGGNGEICLFKGHGNSSEILFEGPGVSDQFYSTDHRSMPANEILPIGAAAKYIEMTACSSQNFLFDGSFATTLLMAGNTMLTYGASTPAWSSSNFVLVQAQELYSPLALGATFAEAVKANLRGNALSMQGDQYISFRPVPTAAPKLVIDGKHYNEGSFVLPVRFADSINGSASQITFDVLNAGSVDLHIQLSWASDTWSIDGKKIPEGGYFGGLKLADLYPIVGENFGSAIGNKIYTIKPNNTMKLTYKMSPFVDGSSGVPLVGLFGSTMEIYSDDPASFRITLDATMKVQ